jgi:diguanylate cyclase (GGDEF)-like protein
LTGLHNLRSFEARLSGIMRSSRETGSPVSLLVLDVDRLKSLNDRYGHLAGADAVRTVGHILGARLPASAVACRYGGDEFVVALPGCDEVQATAIADDLRGAVHAAAPVLARLAFPAATLSISIGLASRLASGEALFRAADAALYRAKEGGRNHVWVA